MDNYHSFQGFSILIHDLAQATGAFDSEITMQA